MFKNLFTCISFCFSLGIICYLALLGWIINGPPTGDLSLKKADAIVVLGAAAWGNYPSPIFKNRIQHGIKLYHSHIAPYLIFTGGTPKKGYPSEGIVAKHWALKQSIPQKAIFAENKSRDTYENLYYARTLGSQKGLRSFIIVSDAYHLPRARLISTLLNMDVQLSPTPDRYWQNKTTREKFKVYLHETNSALGALIYHISHQFRSIASLVNHAKNAWQARSKQSVVRK